MPHKVGKKWKWGNIERSSKEDLRKIVYGIWMKNGSKGSFSKFWKTGKVNENEDKVIWKKIIVDGREVGKYGLSIYDDIKAIGIGSFEIYPAYRDKGLGTSIVNSIVKKYKDDYDMIYCFVDADNKDAIRFYKRLGKVSDEVNDNNQHLVTLFNKLHEELDKLQSKMVFKKVSRDELVPLLDEIETYNESKRFKREQFEKYLSSDKMIDSEEKSMYYGLFSLDGHCLALSYLNKTPDKCILVAQISCVVPSYGCLLLQDIISRSKAVWLAADPTAEGTLLDYYRTFGLEEVVLDHSKWADGKEEHFFLKAEGELRDRILSIIEGAKA